MSPNTTSFSSRFGDTPLAFAMVKYITESKSAKPPLWRFEVRRYCGGDPYIEIDANLKTLLEMRRFIDEAIAAVKPATPDVSAAISETEKP